MVAAAVQAARAESEQAGGDAPAATPPDAAAGGAAGELNAMQGRRMRLGASFSGPIVLCAAADGSAPGGCSNPSPGLLAAAVTVNQAVGLRIGERSLSEGAAAQLPIAPLRLAPLAPEACPAFSCCFANLPLYCCGA